MKKQYVGYVRASVRDNEQARRQFDAQERALADYAESDDGELIRCWRAVEPGGKSEQREAYRELLTYLRMHAANLAGVLFCGVDRATRNIGDCAELQRLESQHGISMIFVDRSSGGSAREQSARSRHA